MYINIIYIFIYYPHMLTPRRHFLALVVTPPPHSTEQLLHELHSDHDGRFVTIGSRVVFGVKLTLDAKPTSNALTCVCAGSVSRLATTFRSVCHIYSKKTNSFSNLVSDFVICSNQKGLRTKPCITVKYYYNYYLYLLHALFSVIMFRHTGMNLKREVTVH